LLGGVERRLADTGLALDTVEGASTVLDELRHCAGRDQVGGIIASICASDHLLAECSSNSVTHPLGFDKLTLIATPSYQLKLHIWWPTSRNRAREDIHDHRFSFASVVLAGSLKTEIFRLDESGTPMARLTEHRDGGDGSYLFDDAGTAGVRHREVSIMGAGSAYYLHSEVLHRVSVDECDLVATLFLKLPPVRHHTTVLVDRSTSAKRCRTRQGLDPLTTRRKLLEFATTAGMS
jgi:hypothetical protein